MNISLIVAHGKNYELGLNNQLLWNIPEDLKMFKQLTSGHHILMGRKTFESIGRPLPNRVSLIISKSGFDTSNFNNTFSFPTFDLAIEHAMEQFENELFIIGGAQIYNTFIDKANTLYISEVDYDGEADAFLKPINYDNYSLVEEVLFDKTSTTPAWKFKKFIKKV